MMQHSYCYHPRWEGHQFPGLDEGEVSALRKTFYLMVLMFVCLQIVVVQGE
jgi:hypothetical protein